MNILVVADAALEHQILFRAALCQDRGPFSSLRLVAAFPPRQTDQTHHSRQGGLIGWAVSTGSRAQLPKHSTVMKRSPQMSGALPRHPL